MTIFKALLTFLFACCLTSIIYAQNAIDITHHTKEYGINYKWVYDITQDDNGFIWFANHTGLRRYDGKKFVRYGYSSTDPNSLSTNTVYRVTTDKKGNIWTYGEDNRINHLAPLTSNIIRTKFLVDKDTVEQLSDWVLKDFGSVGKSNFVALFQDKNAAQNNELYALWKYNYSSQSFEYLLNIPTQGANLSFFTERSDGKLWLWGMGDGYYLVDIPTATYKFHPVKSANLVSVIGEKLPIDANNNFWYPPQFSKVTNSKEVLKSFKLPIEIDGSKIDRISLDNRGNIWFYHNENDLWQFNRNTQILEKYQDPVFEKHRGTQLMYHIFVDQQGNYWNGHFFGAIAFIKKRLLFKTYLSESGNSNLKTSIAINSRDIIELSTNKLLVRNNQQQFYTLDLSTGQYDELNIHDDLNSGNSIKSELNSTFLGNDGYLWANTSAELKKIDLQTGVVNSFKVFQNESKRDLKEVALSSNWPRIFEDASNQLWWCDSKGLFIYDKSLKKMNTVKTNYPPELVVADFKNANYDEERDAIYGRYKKGVYVIHCKTKSVTLLELFSEQEGYDLAIISVLKKNGAYWIATNKGLIRYISATKERNFYTRREGLASNVIHSMLGSENHLWLGTQNGLSQLDLATSQFTNFYTRHGLSHNEFNLWSTLKSGDGLCFFGNQNGIVGFNPNDFEFSPTKSGRLNFVEISAYNEINEQIRIIPNVHVEKVSEIAIKATERNLRFEYMLSSFNDEDPNRYTHYLENYDEDWIEDGERNFVTYSKVPPGNYTLHIKAIGPDKQPALNQLQLEVVVHQYWYLRWWAFLVYVILFSWSVFSLYQFQLHRRLEQQEVKKIKELDVVKTRMYTNITHEFRTPLTVILGMNEEVKEFTNKGEINKIMHANEMIDRNGRNLLNLVNQMLELSKLESGQILIRNQQGNIVHYLNYLLESFDSYAAEKGIQIHFLPERDEIEMDYDSDKIAYIIGNLMSNAIKFTPKGGKVYVSLNFELDKNENPYLSLKVRDTGIGIAEEKLHQIFERFYQVDDTDTRSDEGTGIGLALVQELVKLLNGTIKVASKFEKGSEFSVLLPITNNAEHYGTFDSKLDVPTNEEQNIALESDDFADEDQHLPLILVVEDNVDVVHYIGASLKNDYRVVTADNGINGEQQAIELIPDIIISDVMMPLKNGFELCKSLKIDERTSHIPVILLTGKSDVDSKIEGLEHGADAYLAKPFNKKELLIRLKNLMSLRAEIQRRYTETDVSSLQNGLPEIENSFILKVRTIILDNLSDDEFNIFSLCDLIFLSRAQLHRKLKALTGESTSQFIRKIRLEKAKELLSSGELNVSEVAYEVGFKTQAHFSRVFSESVGISPSDFKKN